MAAVVCLSGAAGVSQAPAASQAAASAQAALPLTLPNKEDALKFGVLGDFGTGKREQYDLGEQMGRVHSQFPFQLMITVGDNLYGGQRPADFVKKFETPYKSLLSAGVRFYASLGNHDSRQQSAYALFNMDGRTYYTFKAPKQDVRFFALESSYLDPTQLQWLERELQNSREDWKIPYFHHPLYSSGDRHGSDLSKRKALEPLFLKYGVSVVFAGHDHVYERVMPQQGITHFVVGSSGQLRKGNIDKGTGFTAYANATEQAFLVAEISGDQLFFNAVSKSGKVIDAGVVERRKSQ
ncbi:MAG TPA: metallophosphoesterase [Vicinamibacterales bacterium]|nr:metallophosphoesterase [Vicinamibacterales bacterium]